MTKKLPIPAKYGGELITEIEIKNFNAEVLADTKKSLDSGNGYKAIQTFITGCVEKAGNVSEKASIREIVGNMPFATADLLTMEILFQKQEDDGIEGYYPCPRCGEVKICEKTDGQDTRDHYLELEINTTEETGFVYHLTEPVEINADDESEIITEIGFEYSTLNQCSVALEKIGIKDTVRLQLAILLESIQTVNGREVDKKWKNRYGNILMGRMSTDLKYINDKMTEFGLKTKVKKNCLKCGKEFEVSLNTANFFASALS
jgi:hypothetical protein